LSWIKVLARHSIMVSITSRGEHMSYRSLAVHLAPTRTAFRRLSLAVALAERLDAQLIGVSAADTDQFNSATTDVAGALLDARRQDFELSLESLQDRFLAATIQLRTRWRSALTSPVEFCAEVGRAADLIIAGRTPESEPSQDFRLDAAALMMRAGRPLLLVPPDVDHLAASRIVVAWKGTREARLAVQQALPLLMRAQDVCVVGVGDETTRDELDDVRDYLQLHKVSAHAEWRSGPHQAVAHSICDFAIENKSDLIVSGGYEHGRMSEWALGGVTKDLLASSPVCLLMAH
jgi:nucleotide-binding universal stress UspA family protein